MTRSIGGKGRRGAISLAVMSALWTHAPSNAQDAFVASPTITFEHRGAPAMYMPTDVAVAPGGAVYVADGVNHRILKFDALGVFQRIISAAGERPLNAPIGIAVDASGRLWIADTGNRRVAALADDGKLVLQVDLEQNGADSPPNVTDVAVTSDGKTAWLTDNDNHRLIRLDIESKSQALFAGKGEALGQLRHPFMVAARPGGGVYVTDVINARVAVFEKSGQPAPQIANYGVDMGQLYRPKGVAIDGQGAVWVSDSSLGVIQVFRPAGGLIDVVRDGAGKPLHFESPVGIAIDSAGDLYVTELTANRVRKFKVTRAAGKPRGATTQRPRLNGQQARSCTVCHIEWMGTFAEGVGTVLMEPPAGTPSQPVVSKSETCLSCHDGSVVDSRRRVWREHGHLTGVEPPSWVKVPARLPLVDGKLACRTCHSAHSTGEPTGDLKEAVFLRVQNRAGELCISCHADHTKGPEFGTHPTGGMPWTIPQVLIDNGAKVGPNPRELTCQVCHTPHGSSNEHLLVMPTDLNQLCLACHDKIRPGMFRDGDHTEHPINATANAAQAAAVQAMGTRLSADGKLQCLSCHKLHHGKGERFMLADELTDGRMCLRCHEDKNSVTNTPHDLRANFPNEKNRLGMTAHTGGQCSSCHLFHRYARTPEVSELDPGGGKCITCHQQGQCAEAKTLGGINHPNVKCVICHDPHTTENKSFLRQSVQDLCSECHDHGDEMFGAHAFEDREDIKNPRGQTVEEVGSCLICHTPHFAVAKPLWGASSEPPATEREKCTVCHSAGGLSASHAIKEFNHTLECKACHNPHGDSEENPALLIVDPPVQNLCLRCHDEHETIEGGPHDVKLNAQAWPKTSLEKSDRCLACHRPHADTKAGLFANGLAPGVSGPDAACLACHREAAWDATSDHAARHPRTATDLDPDDEYLPLVPLGDEEDEYRIGCRTCHNPHNGVGPPGFLVRAEEGDPTAALCTECHDGKGHIGMTGHSPASLSSAGLETESCKPCHGVHADPALSADELLWMPKLAADARLPADGRCLGCHRANGPAKPPAIVSHPDVPMLNTTPPDSDAFLPLFADTGQIDPHGTIACATCHLPHGRDGGGDQADALPISVQRAMRLELRPFRPPNVCSTCHGLDANRRFLYFHDPKRRTGPLR